MNFAILAIYFLYIPWIPLQLGPSLQQDGLHPTREGMAILAACILGTVEGIIGPGSRVPVVPSHPFSQWLGQNRAAGHFRQT